MNDDLKITFYEPWMKPQIATLFENEYGVKKEDFEDLMTRLYEHPMQQEKCIKLVALDGEKVVAFQSFFYWPYIQNNSVCNSFQSGNSLTHPEYRGKGIFKRLLNFVFENSTTVNADFFIGFPVQASYGSFIKNKWINVLNLKWYVKLINPFGIIFRKNISNVFSHAASFNNSVTGVFFRLDESADFYKWKNDLKPEPHNYFYYSHAMSESGEIIFEMKIQTRKKVINEVIIGKVYFKGDTRHKLYEAFKELLKKLRKLKCVTICSMAINESFKQPDYKAVLEGFGFKRIDKEIYFIVRPVKSGADITKPELWDIGRADIDTW